jgi:transposase
MQRAKYTAEFKEEAVRQVIDRDHSVIDVVKRLEIGDGLLYTWVKKYKAVNERFAFDGMKSVQAKLNCLNAEVRRTTD